MDVDRTRLDDVIADEDADYDPEEAEEVITEWLERVPSGDEPVEREAEADGGQPSDPTGEF